MHACMLLDRRADNFDVGGASIRALENFTRAAFLAALVVVVVVVVVVAVAAHS